MGARLRCREEPPAAAADRGAPLHGISYELPVASAQVKSCLLFAGLLAEGETRIVEPLPSRDHTERMLAAAGAEVERERRRRSSVRPAARLEPGEIVVPADFSSAAFFLVAALLVPGSEVTLAGVGLNPTRTGLLRDPRADGRRDRGRARGRARRRAERHDPRPRLAQLRGTEVGGAEMPLAIDELPLVALAACFAEGETTIRDAAELRRKESDRIATVSEALTALGAAVEPTEDGMRIEGGGGLRGGAIDSHGDHRIAMLGAIAGLASREGVEVAGMDAAAVSYPRLRGRPRLAAEVLSRRRLDVERQRRGAERRRSSRTRTARLCDHGHRDRRARRGRQVHRGPRRRAGARLHLPRLGGDVPLRGAGGDRARRRPRRRRRDGRLVARSLEIGLDGDRVALDGRDVSAAIREPRVTEASSRVSVHPPVREAMVARQRRLIAAGRYVAEGRDIGTVVSPDAPLKVFLTASRRGARPPPRRADRRGRGRGARRPARARRARRDAASTAPCAPRADAVEIDTTGLALDEVVDRVVALARERGSHDRCGDFSSYGR